MNDKEISAFVEKLNNKLDLVLNNKNVSKIKSTKEDQSIEIFNTFDGNKFAIYFMVPGATKNDVKVFLTEKEEGIVTVKIVREILFNKTINSPNIDCKYSYKMNGEISIVKNNFDFEDIFIDIKEGLGVIEIKLKSETINKEQNNTPNTNKNNHKVIVY